MKLDSDITQTLHVSTTKGHQTDLKCFEEELIKHILRDKMDVKTVGVKRDNPQVIKNNENKYTQYYFGKIKFWEAITSKLSLIMYYLFY